MRQIDDSSELDDDSEDSDVGQRPRKKKRRIPSTSTRKGKLEPNAFHEHTTYHGVKLRNAYPRLSKNLQRMIATTMDDGKAKVDRNAGGSMSVTSHEQQKSASLPVV